jgi:hypothetical protein
LIERSRRRDTMKRIVITRDSLAVGKDGSLHVNVPDPGTVWLHTSAKKPLISLDNYGPTLEVVVYGDQPIKIRRAGSPLESALLYHPVSNRTRPVAGARDIKET